MRVLISPRVFDAALNGLQNYYGDCGEFDPPRLFKIDGRHWVTYGHLDDIQIGDLLTFMLQRAEWLDGSDAPAADDIRKECERIRRQREALGVPWHARRDIKG